MKYKEFNNTYIEINDVMKKSVFKFFDKEINQDTYQVSNRIFTDGIFVNELEEEIKIDEYEYCEKKYSANTLIKRKIYLKDYSYIVVFTSTLDFLTLGNIKGWFNRIRNVEVYVKNKKDKEALRKARNTINMVYNNNSNVDYSSIFSMLFSRSTNDNKLEYERKKDIYTLKKKI